MPRKKILHFITDMDVGGTELMLVRLLPHLNQVFDTHVCCAMGEGPIGIKLGQESIPVHYLHLRHRADLAIIYRFYRLLKELKPDILVTHLIHPDIFGRIFGRLFGLKKVICSQQGSLLQWEFLRFVDRWSAFLVTHYIVQTELAKKELMAKLHVPENKFTVIPNSVIPIEATIPRSKILADVRVPRDRRNIICVSRLRRRKGHDYLLSAFERVWQKNPNFNLLLAGNGEREHALRRQSRHYQSREAIFWLGNRHDIPDLLHACDLFILPTLAEGMSNAILEAMAAGLPCLVSDIPVNKVLIQDNVNGRLFKTADSDDLSNKMMELLTDDALRARLGQQAQRDVRERFNPQAVAEQWVRLLTTI